ncbi:MAG: Mrp/NBP35 family ATP-binding protein [Acidimicrobiia bacterium]|nr:Mrp/NBP35 family ATP-binding protein [Acidimicrobiia bacterium]MYB23586.1 Mrp/NBP35 family ATP-binding protein [Acidimicrobiia bacterium]MYE67707.1 Mrp/NBP35 family ATP-binding protein [Acidimicrobiia bacterium]
MAVAMTSDPTPPASAAAGAGAASATAPSPEAVLALLRDVIDPELGSNIVELGMVAGTDVAPDGQVTVTVALTTMGCPLRAQIQRDVRNRVATLPGVRGVDISWTELSAEGKAKAMAVARRNVAESAPDTEIPLTTKVLLIASGKGGVGKSSISVNLAMALATEGHTVGLLDADIWGYSVPRMLDLTGRLEGAETERKILPQTRAIGSGMLKVVSMGLLVDDEQTALMWRGLILNRAVRHFLEDVLWGPMDFLVVDMPPGTGDVQMGIAKLLPRAEMIIVTTPSRSVQNVAARAANMGRNNYLRIAGVIENMTAYVDPDGNTHALFGEGGGEALAAEIGAPLLGKVPIDPTVSPASDAGAPFVTGEGPAAEAVRGIAKRLVDELVPAVELAGCSAHLAGTPVSLTRRGS